LHHVGGEHEHAQTQTRFFAASPSLKKFPRIRCIACVPTGVLLATDSNVGFLLPTPSITEYDINRSNYWNHSRKQEKNVAKIITSQSKKISNRQKRFLKAIFPKNWMKENRKIMHKNVNYKSNIHKNGNA